MGWECPKCGRVYAPSTPQCYSCPPQVVTTSTLGLSTGCRINGETLEEAYRRVIREARANADLNAAANPPVTQVEVRWWGETFRPAGVCVPETSETPSGADADKHQDEPCDR